VLFSPDDPPLVAQTGSSGSPTTSGPETDGAEGSGSTGSGPTSATSSTDATEGTGVDASTTGSASASGETSSSGDTSSGDETSTGAEPACGDGSAQPGEQCLGDAVVLDVGCPPQRLNAGDLDGNGNVDLVYAAVDDAELHVFLGDGGGDFVAGPAEALGPRVLTLGHFNADEDLDIAFLDAAIELNVVLNDGNASLPGNSSGVAVVGNLAIASGDLDNDGYDDVVTVGGGSSIGISLSNPGGSGVLTPATVGGVGGTGSRNGVVVADLNGNADLDFAWTDILGGGRVMACLGDGAGGAASCNGFDVGDLPTGLAAGDVDGDGITDLATADTNSNSATVLLGQGNGGFEDGITVPMGSGPQRVVLADLDNDGFDDLVVTHGGEPAVHMARYDLGTGTFEASTVLAVSVGTPTDVVAADFNGDGALDLAVGNTSASAVTLWLSEA